MAPLPRAVVDACRGMRHLGDVRALVAEAVQSRRVTVAALQAEIEKGASAGSALVRRAIGEVASGARSAPEAEVLREIAASSLPQPHWNQHVYSASGEWLACVDAWWRAFNTVLEIDSKEWHLAPNDWLRTLERHERLTRHGLLVIHIAPLQFRRDPSGFISRLAETLAVGATLPAARVRSDRGGGALVGLG